MEIAPIRLLLTPEAAADAMDIGRSTIYELIRTGEIESVKIGRSRRIPREALERYVEQLVAGVGPSAA